MLALAALWIGGILLVLGYFFLFLTFPRITGTLSVLVLMGVFGRQILSWLGFTPGGIGSILFLVFYLMFSGLQAVIEFFDIEAHGVWWARME